MILHCVVRLMKNPETDMLLFGVFVSVIHSPDVPFLNCTVKTVAFGFSHVHVIETECDPARKDVISIPVVSTWIAGLSTPTHQYGYRVKSPADKK